MTRIARKTGPGNCPFRTAVVQAYRGMIRCGHCHCDANRVAERVFRWHDPDLPDAQREARILAWVRPRWVH